MCAIFGWFNPEMPRGANKEKLLKQLARKSQAWGNKSFGMAAMIDGELDAVKYTGPASQWLEQNSKTLKKWASSKVLLGHTRMPTHGAVTKANTHPFVIGDWVAAHNGVIDNSAKLMAKSVYVAKGETDSEEALCYAVTHEFAKEALAKIDGYFAFEAMKKDGTELVLAVDDRARLYTVKLGDGAVWCTDRDALETSLLAVGIRAEATKLESSILRLPAWSSVQLEARRPYTRPLGNADRSRAEAQIRLSLGEIPEA